MMSTVPVAFLIFNRPYHTQQVFEAIRLYRPSTLLVIADGPRDETERVRCEEARSIITQVDWPCDVRTNFSDVNLGCKRRVSSGLDWVFDQCEEAIILEDDCLPHPSFFRYCDELLDKYRLDTRIMSINGSNVGSDELISSGYRFSRRPHIWGWATWKRAWRHYDVDMTLWPRLRGTTWLLDLVGREMPAAHWRSAFDDTWAGKVNTWDYQWFFSILAQGAFVISPDVNLVSNIGFGVGATHTTSVEHPCANMPVGEMRFPLQHPSFANRDVAAELAEFERHVPGFSAGAVPTHREFNQRLKRVLPRPLQEALRFARSRLRYLTL